VSADIDQAVELDFDQLAGAGLPHETEAHMSPVPVVGEVTLSGRVPTVEQPADYGTYRTIVLVGTEARQLILPQDNHRTRAWVIVSGTGPVWVGTEAQCSAIETGRANANTAGGGALLATGQTLPVQHRQTLWLVPDGTHSATVVVAQERMAT
jgi:hypothetical protein